jgi:hypothetical protein
VSLPSSVGWTASAAQLKVAHRARQVALIAILTGLFALINPLPASAHIVGTGGSPTDYRTVLTGIRPAAPAVAVTVGLGGQWVRVTNQGAATILIPGYQGEPFLQLSDNQVQVNQLSSTAFQTGLIPAAPAPGTPAAAPAWKKLSEGSGAVWTDGRIAPPQSSPASGSWQLPLVVDGQQVTALGTRDLIPSPSPWPWLVALVILVVAVGALGRRRDWHRPIAVVIGVGILSFSLHVLGTALAPQQYGRVVAWVSVGLLAGFAVVVGVVSVVSALRRSAATSDRAVVTGAIILLLAATDISVLWNSELPFGGPAFLDRALTVIFYGAGLGLIVAGVRRVRAARAAGLTPEGTSG